MKVIAYFVILLIICLSSCLICLNLSKQLFNHNWHKLQFSVTRNNIEIYIDCNQLTSQPLPPRRQVDLNGDIHMGIKDDGNTTEVNSQFSQS